MAYTIEQEINLFDSNMAKLRAKGFGVEKHCDFGYTVVPEGTAQAFANDKTIGLTLLGIIHGTEWVGSAVLNEILSFILRDHFQLRVPVAFALGNPWAAKENKRFLDSDLNRSFAVANPQSREHLRAVQLQKMLQNTAFLLDFHQTTEKSEQPFFIFPYGQKSYEFACSVSQQTPIVTHWGRPFSKDGQCSDEFTNKMGGTGITIELGQNGFDAYQIAAGTVAGLKAIEVATANLLKQAPLATATDAELYTWAQVIDYPEGEVSLEPGFYNFAAISSGQKIGEINGKELLSSYSGRILFPAYPNRARLRKPAELCRIMRRITADELGKS